MTQEQKFDKAAHDAEKLMNYCAKNNIQVQILLFNKENAITVTNQIIDEAAEVISCIEKDNDIYKTCLQAAYIIATKELNNNSLFN